MRKRRALAALLIALLSALSAGCACAEGYGTAIIDAGNSDRLHLRALPSFEAESRGLYFTGTQVVFRSGSVDGWVKVTIGAQTGYMYSAYVKTGREADKVVPAQPLGVITAKNGANMRNGPSTGDAIVTTIPHGGMVTILGETSGHWYWVDYQASPGYVSAELVKMQSIRENIPAAFGSVLLGEKTFVNAFSGAQLTVDELDVCFALDAAQAVPTRFAMLEMDSDGDMEVVVCAEIGGADMGFLVLDVQGEQVYGYPFYLRSMNELKNDGSFSYSSGAADCGFGTVSFVGDEVFKVELARSRMEENGEVQYQVRGDAATREAFDEAVQKQAQKPEAVWHAFTRAQIEAQFQN